MAEQFYIPGEFVTFPAIEWQHYAFGHKVICFMNPDQPMLSPYDFRYDTPDKLFAELKKSDAFVQVHHTGYKLDCHVPGTDWEYNDEDIQTVLEISSCHGSSEKENSERPLNNPGSGYLQDALDMGKHIGVIGGSDGHNGLPVKSVREPRMYPGGMACLYAKDLTRQGLFEAFRNRRCYGTTGAKIILEFEINSNPMGSIISSSDKREIKITVAGTNVLSKIEIIKNNEVIFAESSETEFFNADFELFRQFTIKKKPDRIRYDLYDNTGMLNLSILMQDDEVTIPLVRAIDRVFRYKKIVFAQIDVLGNRRRPDTLRWAVMPYLHSLSQIA